MQHRFLVSLDLEMNQPSGKIIQIGACYGDIQTGEILSSFSTYVNPEEPLAPQIKELCGVSEDLTLAPQIMSAYQLMKTWLKRDAPDRFINPLTWGGSDTDLLRSQTNHPDDWPFGRRHLDTKTLYVSWCLANNKEVQGGLARSMTKFGLKFEGRKHNALHDAQNTFCMYHRMLRELKHGDRTRSTG